MLDARRGRRVQLPTELLSGRQSRTEPLKCGREVRLGPNEDMHHSTRVWVGRTERWPGNYQGT